VQLFLSQEFLVLTAGLVGLVCLSNDFQLELVIFLFCYYLKSCLLDEFLVLSRFYFLQKGLDPVFLVSIDVAWVNFCALRELFFWVIERR
jgi:hypothetical protein